MTMRTGLLTYALDRASGGIGRYTEHLLASLQSQGLSLTILQAGSANGQANSVSLPGARLLPGLMTVGQWYIAAQARRLDLDIVHDPTGTAPLALARTRRVATIHDVVPYKFPETSTTLDRLIYRLWLPQMASRLDAVITDSRQSKEDIMRHLPIAEDSVTVIPLAAAEHYRPMSADEIQPALDRHNVDFPYILYLGSLTARKNLPRLLQAYAELRQWSDTWRLVIVGARKWKSSPVFETVQRLGLEAHVHFTGFVEEEDLPALYNGADLFVFPSIYEGFGLPVLEAMACGTPVVTSNTSSLPEVAGDAAIMVDPYNVEAIAEAMRRILEDEDLAQDLRERGLARAAQFSWERTARETIKVYEQVLERHN